MNTPRGWRAQLHRVRAGPRPHRAGSRPRLHQAGSRPRPATAWLTWIGQERLAIGALPTADSVRRLPEHGVTHLVNCRATAQTWLSRDLAAERATLGASHVAHAPMWDFGQHQHPRRWSAAARFAARALDQDPHAHVFIHCQRGRRRSVLLAYAVLRLRGHAPDEATALILGHRHEATLVPAYRDSVERWLATRAQPGPLTGRES